MTNPTIVLIPFDSFGERLFRICRFLAWQPDGTFVSCLDTGLIMGKSKRIYPEMKRAGKEYSFPCQRATFAFDGGKI